MQRGRAENAERLREEAARNDALLAPDGSADVTDSGVQSGRRLARSEFIRRITRINPALRYEQSFRFPDHGGIYVIENRMDPMTGKPPWKRFVCGLPHQTIGEFSLRITKPALAPVNATDAEWRTIREVDQQEPGWRSVLLRLMREGLLSPSDIDREFKITQGRSSQKWQSATT